MLIGASKHSIANRTQAPNANDNETAKAVAIFFTNYYGQSYKELVRGTIFKNKYRMVKLQDVSQEVLGKGKYGSGAISGENVQTLTSEH
jgi:hypothetical protein